MYPPMTVYIDTTDALAAFCRSVSEDAFVTVDTEFIREKTYWPQLCLVQVAGEKQAVVIDPLSDRLSLDPLHDLMQAPILKVFHAARQDVEIFHNLTGQVPGPLFDTQIGAMACGFGESVGYENLIGKLVGAKIDKSSRYTDWSRRPLTERQLDYALSDVTHLRPAYGKLHDQLERKGRKDWIHDEMKILSDPGTYLVNPDEAWKRIRVRNPKPRMLTVLREVTRWRELEARSRNMPRAWVLKDEAVLEIAAGMPKTPEDLSRIRGLGRGGSAKEQESLLAAVRRGLEVPDHLCLKPEDRTELSGSDQAVIEMLKVLLKIKAEEHDVAPRLIAGTEDLEALAVGSDPHISPLRGWRRVVFGDDALALRDGKLGLSIRGGRIHVAPVQH
ncbi:MAG: ribonuclease D [Pseudomonadota bacterium]|nr:ribonuclease D [Pseudomonadota bacterium]